jgi:hypothetical protein
VLPFENFSHVTCTRNKKNMQVVLESLPRLFLKPPSDSSEILFSKFSQDLVNYISFRSFDIKTDLDLIYNWVNQPYATEFWKMNGSKQHLVETYLSIVANPHAHSFIGLLGSKPICQIDVYRVLADELAAHVSVNPEDCGMHFLMGPIDRKVKGLSRILFASFLKFYFSFPIARVMYGEPDTNNHKARKVVEDVGFEYLHEAELSYKTASVYKITRQSFSLSFL